MEGKSLKFAERAAKAARDERLEKALRAVADRFGKARQERLAELGNFEELREQMNRIKETVLSRHEEFVAQVKAKVEALGGHVHFAKDANAACRIITRIALTAGAKTAVKAKSMTSEEVRLNPALLACGLEVFETDLGEYIIQLADEPPFHIVLPAIHMTRREIGALFADKLQMALTDSPEALTKKAREVLREKFLAADLGISGANAVVAENGAIVLFSNEGNIRMSTTLPRIHVALAGIEKIIPRMDDLKVLLALLPRSATGQKMSAYVSMIRGPRRADERDGPREFHLVLLDNGRSRLRADPVLREALKCIRCGACLNVCPVFQHIGGHAYGSVYPGPIGAMITQALGTGDEGWQLPFASSLCGACTEACSSKIPIHHLLIELRRRAAEGKRAEGLLYRAWSETWSRPGPYKLSFTAASLGSRMMAREGYLRLLPWPASGWTRTRDLPAFAEKSFHQTWKKAGLRDSLRGPDIPVGPNAGQECPAPLTKKIHVASPHPGDPRRLAAEIEALGGVVFVAGNEEAVRGKLREILSAYAGQGLVRWDHPELTALGLDELAREMGVKLMETGKGAAEEFKPIVASAALGVTAVDCALADSGTLALFTGPGQERSISLLPPAHLALCRADKIVAGLDGLFEVVGKAHQDFRGLTLITGPSRTADIELVPVIGVHGPEKLAVIIY